MKYAQNGIKIQYIHDCERTTQKLKTVASKETFKKYLHSRFPSFDPLPPCSPLLVFAHPSTHPPQPQGTLVCLVEPNVSFKNPQWNLYKVDTIGHKSVHFMEMSAL